MAKKILIVDDDADIRDLLNIRLRQSGYETAFAADAISAIGAARKEHPDLIILDLGLPAGEGYTVMERLKALAPTEGVPILVVSARDPAANRERALRSGAKAYLEKPIEMQELLLAIERELGTSDPRL